MAAALSARRLRLRRSGGSWSSPVANDATGNGVRAPCRTSRGSWRPRSAAGRCAAGPATRCCPGARRAPARRDRRRCAPCGRSGSSTRRPSREQVRGIGQAGQQSSRRCRWTSWPVAVEEVAGDDAGGGRARLAQGEAGGQVAGHEVVAERGQQRAAARGCPRPGVGEYRTHEAGFAGRVDVVRTGGDRGVQRRPAVTGERPDGRGEHVAACRPGARTDFGSDALASAVSRPPSSAASASIFAGDTSRQHRLQPARDQRRARAGAR